jgi:predicted small lipoprotein YifL
MSRALAAAAALFALAGCGGRAATKPEKAPAADRIAAVQRRASAASDDLDREAGFEVAKKTDAPKPLAAPTGTMVPQADGPRHGEAEARRGRILGKDPEGCTWVEGEATVVVGDQDTTAQARAAAIEQARAAAVQDFLGVDVNAKFMDFQQEGLRRESHLVESILQTTRNGRIIKEKIGTQGYKDAPDCPTCRYHLELQACVLPLDSDRDKDFHVDLQLSRVRFVQGDEAKLTITATRDCSVYLYDIYDLARDNKTALVVPNEAVPSKVLKAGQTWEYPDEDAKKAGVRLVAELPSKGDTISAETIRVVATKTPLPASVYDPKDGGYLGVLQRLHHSKQQWAEDAAAYTISDR